MSDETYNGLTKSLEMATNLAAVFKSETDTEISRLQVRTNELQDELAEYKQMVGRKCLLGSNRADVWRDLVYGVGCTRLFSDNLVHAYDTDRLEVAITEGLEPIFSFKPITDQGVHLKWEEVGEGYYDSLFVEQAKRLQQAARGGKIKATCMHEPEDDVQEVKPYATKIGYRKMQARLKSIFQVEAPNVSYGQILMAWTWDPSSGRKPDQYFSPAVEWVGVDGYDRDGQHSYQDIFKRPYDYIVSKGKKFVAAEIGSNAPDLLSWIIDMAQTTKDWKWTEALSWFDSKGPTGTTWDWRVLDLPTPKPDALQALSYIGRDAYFSGVNA